MRLATCANSGREKRHVDCRTLIADDLCLRDEAYDWSFYGAQHARRGSELPVNYRVGLPIHLGTQRKWPTL
jgi:hypothetical protein